MLRASDAERERAVQVLRDGAAAGRLDPEELERRLERAYAAELREELVPLVADLPEGGQGGQTPRRRPTHRAHGSDPLALGSDRLVRVAAVAVLLVAIWALTGAGYFWPVWPIGAMALGAFKGGCCGVSRPPGLARR